MGDPRRLKNKYSKPKKLFDAKRIKEEKKLKKEYGLKKMQEIWIAAAELKKIRREARALLSLPQEERERRENILFSKLDRLGILDKNSKIEDVLALTVRNILDRRLQTLVFKKGLAKTPRQARQLITHGFIAIGNRKVTVPSYMVTRNEEKDIRYIREFNLEGNTQTKAG